MMFCILVFEFIYIFWGGGTSQEHILYLMHNNKSYNVVEYAVDPFQIRHALIETFRHRCAKPLHGLVNGVISAKERYRENDANRNNSWCRLQHVRSVC